MFNSAKCFFVFRVLMFIVIVLCVWSQFRVKTKQVYNLKNETLKYILEWTLPHTIPFVYLLKGQQTFIDRKCLAQNCFVTSDKLYFDDVRKFDAIVFHGPEIVRENLPVPELRTPEQKYIFASLESSHYYPVCNIKYNNFFNWTWTYRLNSDISYDYLKIRDKWGTVIGPKEVMHWERIEVITNTTLRDDVKSKLQSKKTAAAWIVSNCNSLSKRELIGKELVEELKKYGLNVDIYGTCGSKKCPLEKMSDCLDMIERDYYFYLAFENSLSNDYVTEKLLHGLKHYAVPVVYGLANYTRFMPDGAYLNIWKNGVKKVSKQMKDLIKDKRKYHNYFKWHNFYSYHDPNESPDMDDYCRLCAKLHDGLLMNKTTVYDRFIRWWNQELSCSTNTLDIIGRFFNIT